MKILYIHQYFKTPEEGGAIRSWYIAKAMVQAGHEVTMITSINQRRPLKTNIDGITVHYLPVRYKNSYGFIRRLIAFLYFAHKAYYLSRRFAGIDLAYITSTPLTVGLVALRLRQRRNVPYIFEVRDLWPEAPIQIGAIKNPLLKAITRRLENHIYRKASKIIALSPGTRDFIKQIVRKKPVLFCPNMSDCDFFKPGNGPLKNLIDHYTLKGNFVISYFGALGKANQLTFLLDLAEKSRQDKKNIRFFIIGDGAMKKSLVCEAKKRDLLNVFFIDHVNKVELKKYLSVTHAAYISFARYPVLEHNSPNKFFDALASGKLVITNTGGWIRDLVEENKCGFYYDPDIPAECLKKLEPFLNGQRPLLEYQKNARKLAENRFERKNLTSKILDFIEE